MFLKKKSASAVAPSTSPESSDSLPQYPAQSQPGLHVEGQGVSKDDELLMNLGYKPELKRNFSIIEVFGIAFSIMSLLPSIASTMSLSMAAGPVGMTWGWIVPSIFILTVGMALGEMGSALPTSGGLYWWTYRFAPEKVKRPLCFLAGYANTLGLIGGFVSIDYGFAGMVLSIPAILSDNFTPTKYMTYGVFVACVITHMAIGSVATRVLSRLQGLCIVLNFIVIIVTVIAVPIGAKHINSGKEVFTGELNLTGWPYGWSFFLAMMSCVWTVGAFDSCIHMSEEASNAATAVPLGMTLSIGICGVLGFAIMAVLAACISDYDGIIGTAYGQPMAQLYMDTLGKKWTVGMMVVLFIVQWFMGLSIVIAASRQTWAFSRDGALPFSNFIRKIDLNYGVPIRALWFDGCISIVIGLLVLVDATAAQALFSLAPASNGLAWFLPIASRHIWYDKDAFTPGPFHLGHFWSRINGFIAMAWLIFVITILSQWPAAGPDPAPDAMNYCCLINGAVWIGSMVYYFVDARKWFTGPKSTLETFDATDIPEKLDVEPEEKS